MNFLSQASHFLSDPNTLWVLSGTVLLGLSSGVIGSFAFLRKRGLMGDVLAHAALPGICLAFMLTGSKNPFFFLIGATVTGILASMAINAITRFSRIKEDTALALVLSVFFGVGIVFLTQIQHTNYGNQSGLDKFLFGQSASLVGDDVWVMGGVAIALLLFSLLFFKEFKLLCFDPGFGRSLGFPVGMLDLVLMLMLVVAVVIGLQAAGVVLMAALIITPAAAARYWTERLDRMLVLSALLGGMSGALGTLFSATTANLPTGPLIVVAATVVFLISLIFSPRRGLLAKAVRLARMRKQAARERVLHSLYENREQGGSGELDTETILQKYPIPRRRLKSALASLMRDGWIQVCKRNGAFRIRGTEEGWIQAYETVLRTRMTEVWMMHENEIGGNLREEGTGSVTGEIPPDLFEPLWNLLVKHGREPKWKPDAGSIPAGEGGITP
ncbi:manganese/zinc/iron transport system permease protein [Melghirimyces profundicolus]|uniref:Manganese transport system membrane protein MntC n=1 Tax=Melghirimyces profundicolus TaxID=1242148 RepID=A0A2T6BGX9_9BACL|nr:metal ABC transporter permease [Melghirimyces profundicolus]PTX55323.1 manganese/zinc/iron transport system permease protein [Melghirimyces profundicolus]